MTNKRIKTKSKTKPNTSSTHNPHIVWAIGLTLCAILIITIALGIISVKKIESEERTNFDNAKLEVFDDIVANFIMDQHIRDEKTIQEMTGYGISDEDDVFYVTFNYYLFNDDGTINPTAHPAIVYFWKDANRGTYSHAYSYPDDPTYHPDGVYVKKSDPYGTL